MKQILVIFAILLLLFFAFQCGKKDKSFNPDLESPSYYYPINLYYTWNYVLVNNQCDPSLKDSFAITTVDRKTRPEGTGWDLVSSAAVGATTFVYQLGDTMFSKEVKSTQPPYKVLVGPVKKTTIWKDTFRGYKYEIVEFEDVDCRAAGGIYHNRCAKVMRTTSGYPNITYFWWAPQFGKVKQLEKDQSGQCVEGEELKRLDKSPEFP